MKSRSLSLEFTMTNQSSKPVAHQQNWLQTCFGFHTRLKALICQYLKTETFYIIKKMNFVPVLELWKGLRVICWSSIPASCLTWVCSLPPLPAASAPSSKPLPALKPSGSAHFSFLMLSLLPAPLGTWICCPCAVGTQFSIVISEFLKSSQSVLPLPCVMHAHLV